MPLGKMRSKMCSVIKFEFRVAMKGSHDWFWAKILIEEFSVLKLTDTCVNLQSKKILRIGHLNSLKMTRTIMK